MSQKPASDQDDLRAEYDFSAGVRGKHHEAYRRGTNVVFLDPEVAELEARNPDEIQQAFRASAGAAAAALIVFDDPVLWSHRKLIVTLAAQRRLPAMYGYSEFVDDGGLMAYGPDRIDLYRRTAGYVDKILKGAKAADLPIEQPTKFEFVVNLKTANGLGLTLPQTLLLRADRVIQ